MMAKRPGDDGIRNPAMFKTLEEASAHQAKVDALEEALLAMTPADRAEWFAANGNTPIEELE